jgi:hypothetical protein
MNSKFGKHEEKTSNFGPPNIQDGLDYSYSTEFAERV